MVLRELYIYCWYTLAFSLSHVRLIMLVQRPCGTYEG